MFGSQHCLSVRDRHMPCCLTVILRRQDLASSERKCGFAVGLSALPISVQHLRRVGVSILRSREDGNGGDGAVLL